MESHYPFSTGRSSLLGTEAFRNLLGTSLKNAKKSEKIILEKHIQDLHVVNLRSKMEIKSLQVQQ
jgi:hypothetical protein